MPAPKPTLAPPRTFVPDDRQQQAIDHVEGPMLVVAGAGTGKTTVLTRRIARLISQGHARPDEVLAVAYTENGAREMLDRVRAELRGTDLTGLEISTFHAYCNNLLIRYNKQFGVIDDKDFWIYLRRRIPELHLDYYIRAANLSHFLEDLLNFMRRCQDELVTPEKYSAYVARICQGQLPTPRVASSKKTPSLTDDEVLGRCREISSVFATVERMLKEDNLGSFGHMITHAYDLLQDPTILAAARQRARFILVDEFQDANFAQVKILQKLAGEERNVFAVGDPDQAIYRFRGASSAAFGLFQRQFPEAKLVVLEKNRRSLTPILKTAFAHISKNVEVLHNASAPLPYRRSPLISARDEEAIKEGREAPVAQVEAVVLNAKESEYSDVVNAIRQRQRVTRCDWSDFAILYRQHIHRDEIAAELVEQGIPLSIENMDVMDTPEARDLFACLGAIISEADDASLFRVAALHQFAVDPEKLRAGMRGLRPNTTGGGVASVLAEIEGGPAVLDAVRQARQEIGRAKSRAALEIIVRRFKLDRSTGPIHALSEFVEKWESKPITKTGEIAELLDYLDYFREAKGSIPMPSRDENAVRLMTAHAVKGLEFNHTFIIRVASPSFPSSYKEPLVEFPSDLRDPDSMAEGENKELHAQEERRLFYVAMTRARDSLTIYGKQGTGKDKTPPGYLRELLGDTTITRWFRQRQATGFQTDLFAEAHEPVAASRTSQWLSRPPASDLSAKLSASAVQTYETCRLQFKLEREWKIPREAPAAMQYGASMHRVLHAYYDSVRQLRPMEDHALLDLFRTDLTTANIQDPYQHQLYEKQGIDQLREFLVAFRRNPAPLVLHLEERFEIKVGGTVVIGRIDRVDKLPDGSVVISDYKTGRPQTQEEADESLQLSIYALAAQQKWGYRADHMAFYNLVENNPVITYRTEADLQTARRKVEDAAANISAGRFEPRTGFHCSFCAYRNLCPATEKGVYTTLKKSPRNN